MFTLTNDQMTKGRFLRWAQARRKAAWASEKLALGLTVCFAVSTHITVIDRVEAVKATPTGLYVHDGCEWLCQSNAVMYAK